jgi:multiple sugar transport system substrate-binding protein
MQRGVKLSAALCVAVALAIGHFPAQAGEQADRAIAEVKQMIARGEIKPGTMLRMRAKQGNMVSFLGRDDELQRDGEKLTGILIDASVMPQLALVATEAAQ